MTILYEDDCILVCIKPAGIATQAAKVTEKDMVSEVNNYIKKAGGNPACLIHRLDKPVGGILLFAKTKAAAGFLSDALQSGKIKKHYYALTGGRFTDMSGELNNYIYKDSKTKKAVITDKKTAGAKAAKLKYSVVESDTAQRIISTISSAGMDISGGMELSDICNSEVTLLDIELITGRYHQIRAQLSHAGHPVTGDSLYGAENAGGSSTAGKHDNAKQESVGSYRGNPSVIGLIAYKLSFPHPVTKEIMEFDITKNNNTGEPRS